MGKKTASTSTSGCPRAGNKVWIPVSQRIPPQSLHQSFKEEFPLLISTVWAEHLL